MTSVRKIWYYTVYDDLGRLKQYQVAGQPVPVGYNYLGWLSVYTLSQVHQSTTLFYSNSVILISHKLEEILSICDRVKVLRKDQITGQADIKTVDKAGLARMMIGRQIATAKDKTDIQPGNIVLEVKNIHAVSDRGIEVVKGINMNFRSGEIPGIAGVSGNGQQEFVDALTGLRHPSGGTIETMGRRCISVMPGWPLMRALPMFRKSGLSTVW